MRSWSRAAVTGRAAAVLLVAAAAGFAGALLGSSVDERQRPRRGD